MEEESLLKGLADFIETVDYAELPPVVVRKSKQSILDFLGVALAGSRTGLAPILTSLMRGNGGRREATLIGEGGIRIPAINAALVNGVKGHTLDMDDGHRYANAHPGAVVIAAAMAAGEREDTTGKELIEAVVAGYEIFLRIGTVINTSHLERGFHTTGTVGPYGAAAACSKVLQLGEEQCRNAMAVAGLQGAGLLEVMAGGQTAKPLQAGKAAQAGVLAACLAAEGVEGPLFVLEGEKGFLRAYADLEDPAKAVRELGENPGGTFEISNTYFKMYPACRHVHATLDAAREIISLHDVDLDEILEVEVKTYTTAQRLTGKNRSAATDAAAKFSLPVSLGLMLVYGKAGIEEYDVTHIMNPRVQEIADKVTILIDEKRDSVYPAERGACVTITTKAQVFKAEIDNAKGEPENPWTDDELKEKFFSCARTVLPSEKAEYLYELVMDIENSDVREIMNYV